MSGLLQIADPKKSPVQAIGIDLGKLQQTTTHLLCMRYWQRFLADAELFQEELLS